MSKMAEQIRIEQRKDREIELLKKQPMTQSELAKAIGVCISTIYQDFKDPRVRKYIKQLISPEERRRLQMIEFLKKGYTTASGIVEALGFSPPAIMRYRKNPKSAPWAHRVITPHAMKAMQMIELLKKQPMTQAELGRAIGMTSSNVGKWYTRSRILAPWKPRVITYHQKAKWKMLILQSIRIIQQLPEKERMLWKDIIMRKPTNLRGTHYAVLSVRFEATKAQIQQAYRKLTKKHHPDKNLKDRKWAEKVTKRITQAYECLSDTKKRRNYDQTLRTSFRKIFATKKKLETIEKQLETISKFDRRTRTRVIQISKAELAEMLKIKEVLVNVFLVELNNCMHREGHTNFQLHSTDKRSIAQK